MTPQQIDRIQTSFARVLPETDRAATLFYAHVFRAAPQVRPLFRGDMTVQGQKLLQTLAVVVDALPRLPDIMPTVRELARRHVRYGVKESYYPVVGDALIATLGDMLGDEFDGDAEAAWREAYRLLSEAMIDAARQAA